MSRFGNINPIPFRVSVAEYNELARTTAPLSTDFSVPLGPTDPCSTAVHMEPLSSLVLKILT